MLTKKSRTKKDGLEYWKIDSIISIVEVVKNSFHYYFAKKCKIISNLVGLPPIPHIIINLYNLKKVISLKITTSPLPHRKEEKWQGVLKKEEKTHIGL